MKTLFEFLILSLSHQNVGVLMQWIKITIYLASIEMVQVIGVFDTIIYKIV